MGSVTLGQWPGVAKSGSTVQPQLNHWFFLPTITINQPPTATTVVNHQCHLPYANTNPDECQLLSPLVNAHDEPSQVGDDIRKKTTIVSRPTFPTLLE